MVAKCRACDAVFSIEDKLRPTALARPPERMLVVRPSGVAIEERDDRWVLTRRWRQPRHYLQAGFTALWCAIVFGAVARVGFGFPIPFVHQVFGVVLLATTAAGLLNRTTVEITSPTAALDDSTDPYRASGRREPATLTVRTGPVPWPRPLALPAADVQQLYVVRERGLMTLDMKRAPTYCVRARLRDGSAVDVMSRIASSDEARFIELEIEQRLGIEPAPVAGELGS
jgi:hypothetical protein